jgi:hypothetical protein
MIASIGGPFTSFQLSISISPKKNICNVLLGQNKSQIFYLKNMISTKTKDLSRKKWTKFTRF